MSKNICILYQPKFVFGVCLSWNIISLFSRWIDRAVGIYFSQISCSMLYEESPSAHASIFSLRSVPISDISESLGINTLGLYAFDSVDAASLSSAYTSV